MRSYSIAELAAEWSCSEKTIRRMIEADELDTFNIGTGSQRATLRITSESVARCESEQPSHPTGPAKATPARRWV